ncbi:MAG TPA: ATP-binding cassette domain-containing protein [Fimbriimonas sp.]
MIPLFEIRDVSVVRDGRTILDRLDLRIEQGQHTAILGPNGSGKSTLIRLLIHEIYPHAGVGSVRIWGEDRWVIRDLRPLLGLVSTTPGDRILGDPTVLDMAVSGLLGTFGVVWGYEVTESMVERARGALRFAGMDHLRDRRFDTLSAGESRRTLIARALVSEPRGLVLDEPTTSLDLKSAKAFRETMGKVARTGTTLVLVTHQLEEIIPEIENIVLLKEGKILAHGPRKEVLTLGNLGALFDMGASDVQAELDRSAALRP